MNGTWIILSNAVGEIDREFVLEGDDLNLALKDLLKPIGAFSTMVTKSRLSRGGLKDEERNS